MKLLPFSLLVGFFSCLTLAGCVADSPTTPVGDADTGCWAEVPAPTFQSLDVGIGGIAAVAGNDIWAIGQQTNSVGGSKTLTLHWDGAAWSIVSSPNGAESAESKNHLYAVAASNSKDIWAVGAYTDAAGRFLNLAMHWNGDAWKIESPPSPGLLQNGMNDVDMLSSNDVWAVGIALSSESQDPYMAIFHWDGVVWRQFSAPEHSSHNLLSVEAISKDDVWAAGTDVLHWDGRTWNHIDTPAGHPGGYLDGIDASGPNDVWVTGNDGNEAIALHWNGVIWSGGNTPKLDDGPFPHDMKILKPGEVWIAGEYATDPAYSVPLLLRWNGREWRMVANPLPGRAARLQSLAVADGTLWAAGTQRDAKSTRPLFLRRSAASCSGTPAIP